MLQKGLNQSRISGYFLNKGSEIKFNVLNVVVLIMIIIPQSAFQIKMFPKFEK